MTFSADLSAFRDKARGRANLIVRKIVLDVGTRLVLKSPVGDGKYWKSKPPKGYVGGRFRANWQYGLDDYSTTTNTNIDASGQATIAVLTGATKGVEGGHIHYITNSLPYSIRLEEGWSYRQAPNGMVALTIEEFKPIVAAAAKALS